MSSVSIVWCSVVLPPLFAVPHHPHSCHSFISLPLLPLPPPNPPPPTRTRHQSPTQSVPPLPWVHRSIDMTPPSLNGVCLPFHHHWPVWPHCPRCCSIDSFDLFYRGKTKSSSWLVSLLFPISPLLHTPFVLLHSPSSARSQQILVIPFRT